MAPLPLLFPKHKHFGLSVGRTSVRGVEVDSNGKIKKTAQIDLPDGIFTDGVLTNPDVFVAHLKKLLQIGGFSTSYVAVCFSESYAYSRDYVLPIIPLTDIKEALSWHVKDLFPFPEEEIYYDWKLLGTNEKEYTVAIVATQKKVLDSLLAAFISVGLKPLSCEPGAQAVSRLLLFKPGQHALIVEVNRRGAYVTLVESGKTLFTTVVNMVVGDSPETYLKNISQTISEVASYYKTKGIITTEMPPVIVSGELATQPWAQQLSQATSYKVQLLNTQVGSPAFNKAYAMAVAPISPPDDEKSINLLPSQIQKFYDDERNMYFYKAVLMRLVIAFGVFFAVSLLAFILSTFERQRLEGQTKALTIKVAPQQSNTQQLLLLNSQAKSIVDLAPLRITPKQKLLVLASLLPESIVINQWEYDSAKVMYIIKGEAKDRADLVAFKEKLESSEEFAKVTLPLGSLESPKNVKFTITFLDKK